ncbi:MAG TPA: hypothetical protein VH333_07085 [Pseudonocardiaceae bacterium]|jgi:hypothetical protein|nr:hypothetical protein [Pseudonocardiaceae bacterium]
MYEDIVAAARQSTEAAVRESQERIDLAVNRSQEADRTAADATKAVSERWVNRINAMRRRAAQAKDSPEHRFGPDSAHETPDDDELVSLSAAPPADPRAPAFGVPDEMVAAQDAAPQPTRAPDESSSWFNSAITYPDDEQQVTPSPPAPRRQPPPRRPRPATDDDDDYSGQSWLQGG